MYWRPTFCDNFIRPEKPALGGPGHTYKEKVFDRTPDKCYEIADVHEQVENFAKRFDGFKKYAQSRDIFVRSFRDLCLLDACHSQVQVVDGCVRKIALLALGQASFEALQLALERRYGHARDIVWSRWYRHKTVSVESGI
jgi:hypothetical protein